jgi:ribosome-binding protein aMBF1 (putative translation factor)
MARVASSGFVTRRGYPKSGWGDLMAKRKERTFSQVIRERRRQLDLTQQEVAQRIRTSTPYGGHLEFGKRHPSAQGAEPVSGSTGVGAA